MMKFRVSSRLLPVVLPAVLPMLLAIMLSLPLPAPAAAAAPATAAADKAGLSSELQVWNVVKQSDGAETLLPAKQVAPGDVLQYTAVYKNSGSRAVTRLMASLPIPAGTELVAASAVPREVLASLDGKVYAAVPLMRKQRRADGQLADVAVPLAEYRFLRWPEQQVAAGASYNTSARVRVGSAAQPGAATPPVTLPLSTAPRAAAAAAAR